LHWRDPDTGARKSEAFPSIQAREDAAKTLADKIKKNGSTVLSFDPVKWNYFLECEKLAGGADLRFVIHEWKKQQTAAPTKSKTVQEAIKDFMQLRDREQSMGVDSKRHAVKQLGRFSSKFGNLHLHEITKEQIRDWLDNLKSDDGEKLGPHAVNAHHKRVSLFFQYAINENWGVTINPCSGIKHKKAEDKDPVVISLRDAWAFFHANHDQRVAARVALEAFAGVRYTTAGLIDKSGLNTEAKGLRMKASIHKTGKTDGRSRYRDGHTDNLWEWIKNAPENTWQMTPLNYREEKRIAAIKAGIRPASNASGEDAEKIGAMRNVWRHSFISYHLAAFKNLPLTQYLAQHSNPQTTEEYEGMAKHDDALRYFMLTPQTAKLPWEKFLKLPIPKTLTAAAKTSKTP